MIKNNISDFIILGGGCSALSFINQVIEQKITKYSFIIIEKKKNMQMIKAGVFGQKTLKKIKTLQKQVGVVFHLILVIILIFYHQ